MLIVLFFDVATNYSDYYSKQSNEILNRNLYRFSTNGLIGIRHKESLIRSFQEYIKEHPIKTIAFTPISTEAYSYPLKEACNIALDEILTFIRNSPDIFDEIAMICSDEKTYNMFQSLYKERL